MAGRIQQHLERLHRWRVEIMDDPSRKRLASTEIRDDTDIAKRQRFTNGNQDGLDVLQFKPELPLPLSQLYTLSNDEGCRNFDVQAIPVDIVVKILVPMLNSLESSQIDTAINVCLLPLLHGPIFLKDTAVTMLFIVAFLILNPLLSNASSSSSSSSSSSLLSSNQNEIPYYRSFGTFRAAHLSVFADNF